MYEPKNNWLKAKQKTSLVTSNDENAHSWKKEKDFKKFLNLKVIMD